MGDLADTTTNRAELRSAWDSFTDEPAQITMNVITI